MVDHRELINELREKFREGATPSALINLVRQRVPYRPPGFEQMDIIEEAFLVPLGAQFGLSKAALISEEHGRVLNKVLLPEMLMHSSEWNETGDAWFTGAKVSDPTEVRKRVADEPYPGLSETSWNNLSTKERDSLLVQLSTGEVLSERTEILALLCERLQRRIEKLEAEWTTVVERGVVESEDNRDVVCSVHRD